MSDTIAVVGLGYVGLPLAVCFAGRFPVIGYDLDESRVAELRDGRDRLGEVDEKALRESGIEFSTDPSRLGEADIVVVTVPTPVNEHKRPDLDPLLGAADIVGRELKEGAIVVFESTVYPGATEEECVPAMERASGKRWKKDFFVGYSPERQNPGDTEHSVERVIKVVSGDTPETAARLEALYGAVISAGVFVADSIQTAEAAKVIENCQRDINIAFVNELALIFQRIGLDTTKVLDTAGTKWNFLPFRPGLVGGHCIGVDPYYLTHKAESVGYHPEVILSGRRINDGMGVFVANRVVKLLLSRGNRIRDARVLILGVTFKENCADVRNSRVIDIIRELEEFGIDVDIHDPVADRKEVRSEHGIDLLGEEDLESVRGTYSAVILAVSHDRFRGIRARDWASEEGIVYDVKSALREEEVDERL